MLSLEVRPLGEEVVAFSQKLLSLAFLAPLVCCIASRYEVKMERDEGPEHQADNRAKNKTTNKHFGILLLHKVVEYDLCRRLEDLTVHSLKLSLIESLRFNYAHNDVVTSYCTIRADDGVEEQEADKVFVIVKANTLVDPDAMVVEFFNARAAHRAVFRARRLFNLTSPAHIAFLEDDTIALVSIHSTEYIFFACILCHTPRIDPTCSKIARVA